MPERGARDPGKSNQRDKEKKERKGHLCRANKSKWGKKEHTPEEERTEQGAMKVAILKSRREGGEKRKKEIGVWLKRLDKRCRGKVGIRMKKMWVCLGIEKKKKEVPQK